MFTIKTKKKLNPESWVDRYGDMLYRFAFARLKDAEAAEEVVQETFLSALKSKDNFAGESAESTWLVGTLKHKIVDNFRKLKRRPVLEEFDENTTFGKNNYFDKNGCWNAPLKAWQQSPNKFVENKELWEIFYACLENLNPATKQVFALREIDGLESKTICEVLNITPTNFWVLLFRARQQLRECLSQRWFGRTEEVEISTDGLKTLRRQSYAK